MRRSLTPEAIEQVLEPFDQHFPLLPGRPAAVLVLLFPGSSGPELVLTVRQPHLNRHAGQVSLPGGSQEPADADLWETATRETGEELGVDPSAIQPLGRLDVEAVRATGFAIAPFVGWLPAPPDLAPDLAEVAQALTVPLCAVCDGRNVADEAWTLRGAPYSVVVYHFDGVVVWGATARILSRFAERLGYPLQPPPGLVRPLAQ